MLEVKNLNIMIATKYFIKSLTFTLNKGDKLAIIGEEGNGKSTLLKSLLGKCDYAKVTGSINWKNHTVGYLEQSISNVNQSVYTFLFATDHDYYDNVNQLYQYLTLLKISDVLLERSLNQLSGGEQVKVRVLKLLLEKADILVLDEPTNDLDLETLEWLETFIQTIETPVIYVSHDETLLSRTANMILHIERIQKKTECKHTFIKSGYDSYVEARLRSIRNQTQIAVSEKRQFLKKEAKLRQIEQKVDHQLNTISRSNPHGAAMLKKKMHALKAQEKRLDNLSLTKKPEVEESIYFSFEEVRVPKNKIILKINKPYLIVDNKVVAQNLKLDVIGNIHLCIIGKNGVGKTSFIKWIYAELKDRTDIKVGYMPQNYMDILKEEQLVLDFLTKNSQESVTKARQYLGNMHFTKEEMTGPIKNLSNGTKAKLLLIKFVLDRCNVLLLDEPTRNVSPLSNPMIRKTLKKFTGTIISVSHDRKYIEEVIEERYEMTREGIIKMNSM